MNRPKDGSDPKNLPDEALVSATLRGDKSAYQLLVERYQGRLLRVALDILKNSSDAEDVVQESFVKAFLSLDKFKNQASFYTWLHRITFNMAVDLQRKNQRRGGQHFEYKEDFSVSSTIGSTDMAATGGSEVPFSQNIEGPQEALLRRETGKKIDQVFASLSDEHRAVITLREVDGLDYEEIAAALGVPRGTVMSRLFYARKALQQALKDFAPDSSQQHSNSEGVDMNTSSAIKSTRRARG
jgi:RNA polymerase sigma-70 factor (ECF subfamily)